MSSKYVKYDLQITRDAKMSTSDKISWIGGMMGLFTGFSVISGLEILYWLWFKVLIHKKTSIAPALQSNESEEDIKQVRRAWSDKKSGIFFDALFNAIEAQDVHTENKTNTE